MLQHVDLTKVLVLDVETVPQQNDFSDTSPEIQAFWEEKCKYLKKNDSTETPESLYSRAGIYAEFGKIVCISAGFFHVLPDNSYGFRIKSFCDDDEKDILENFASLLNTSYNKNGHFLCAHNGREFDYPYIARRMLVNGVVIPKILDIPGKKPWEADHLLDTMQLWRFGDFKNFTSLALLANILGIKTPKDDIKGSDVGDVYWKEKNVERIVSYCQKDVLTVAQILLRFKNLPLIDEENVVIASEAKTAL